MNANELIQHTLTQLVPNILFDIQVSDQSRDNIHRARELSRRHPTWSIIGYGKHSADADTILLVHGARRIAPYPGAILVGDYRLKTDSNFAANVRRLKQLMGIEAIPTIQTGHTQRGYTEAEAFTNKKALLRRIQTLPRPSILLIYPEGTRGHATLGPVEKGFIDIGKALHSVLYIPIGLWFDGPQRKNLNLWQDLRRRPQVHLEVGEIVEQPDRHNAPSVEILMINLARTLPRELRGAWA